MVMVADSLPGLKRWTAGLGLRDSAKLLVIRMVVTFLLHAGRMSCLRAAGAVRCETRHRAQISRFLARPRWRKLDINSILRQKLLEQEASDGLFLFLVDATLNSQAGKKTENTYSTGNRSGGPQRASLRQEETRSEELPQLHDGPLDHAFGHSDSVLQALLYARVLQEDGPGPPHHSRGGSRSDPRIAAAGRAQVIVLGDTAYDSEAVQKACQDRSYSWIVPCNPERLGRPEREAAEGAFALEGLVAVVAADHQAGSGARLIRRVSASVAASDRAESETAGVLRPSGKTTGALGRRGPLVFSTTQKDLPTATPDDVKILMTNDLRLSVCAVIELYSLRGRSSCFSRNSSRRWASTSTSSRNLSRWRAGRSWR